MRSRRSRLEKRNGIGHTQKVIRKWKGTWAVTVSGNWRITFRFEDGDAIDVDYEDYH
ncbi:MAG: type II toxin-antitoxin system RelE/ParE family toxin [Candidatus Omnitrophica bacterium]|nr:type II toxin-antitoxin system RelE/ParE family toxin [Candidatus Omnitrophota bacterium]MCA9426095.1 type II toxin-antitoxin system RelE/ParE family toxin [Candidatus Omnitrophota bacterium]MCA9433830.1 type II toxin-antitoxin system RelE/ParE family toxin [Candidatus Omnitrophota bacterium]MCA9437333.1 type II toxin-antitoxin system RelE/ParE family toxin [Candidatus Omnitrophota bacterium]MCA9441959.1 type II toxin-antitoxin system RelE/ParE family toxin [Candidatus Omnitrophota bacterium